MSHCVITPSAVIAVAVALLGAPAPGQAQNRSERFTAELTSKESRTIETGAAGSLQIKGISGTITITAGAGSAARLDIERRARGLTDADAKQGLADVTSRIEHTGTTAVVTTVVPEANGPRRPQPYRVDVNYTATVPRGTHLRLTNAAGDVTITGVEGDVTVEIMSGNIRVSGTPGAQTLHTMSGDVSAADIGGDAALTLRTFSGRLTLERVRARRISADAMSGDVTARDVAAADVSLTTLSGDVELSGSVPASGQYELRTQSGDLLLTLPASAGVALEATTFSGDLAVPSEFGGRDTERRSRSVRGTVGSGALRVTVSSLNGDVTVIRK